MVLSLVCTSCGKCALELPGRRPSDSRSMKAGPRRVLSLSALASTAAMDDRSFASVPSMKLDSRSLTRSRCAPSRNSLGSTSTTGLLASAPARSRAMSAPSQVMRWSAVSAKASALPISSAATRRGISSRRARRAARRTSLRVSSSSAVASGWKMKPSTRPTLWPSTITSPCLVTALSRSSSLAGSRRRMSCAARRSTKRWVRRSCSASLTASSAARAWACIPAASFTQSARAAM